MELRSFETISNSLHFGLSLFLKGRIQTVSEEIVLISSSMVNVTFEN